jgi:hypothetical protein
VPAAQVGLQPCTIPRDLPVKPARPRRPWAHDRCHASGRCACKGTAMALVRPAAARVARTSNR